MRVDPNAGQRRVVRLTGARTIALLLLLLSAWPSPAHASFLSPELEDKIAGVLAILVLVVVPVVLITLFWMVHVLPEKIAHKRHHPQLEGIRTLCLLSLVFGGLLWPLAWLWAYSKPVMYKLAYGTDRAPDALGEHAAPIALSAAPAALGLSDRVARLEQRGVSAADLSALRADLEAIEARQTVIEER